MTDLSCTHLPEGICDGCLEALADESTPAPLIVSAVELRAWARASQLLAEREGFPRTAASVGSYIDLLDLAIRSGAHSFELRPITPPLPAPFGAVRIQVPLEAGAADPRQDMNR